MIAPNSGSEPISSDTRVALLRPSARFCANMANSVANSTRYSVPNQKPGSTGSAGSPPGSDTASRMQPAATTPLCTAVSASAEISRPAVNRRVRQTSTARSNAAASISASPRLSESCGPPVSSQTPASDSAQARNSVLCGRWRSSSHSMNGVITTHRLIRNAALLALVNITPQVSQRKIASITSPSGRPGRSARRPAPRSCGSSRTKVRPKRIARKPSTG
ncbi:Uncharacterised protein [Stutzerimonas stutzeri]|nr:Uncharacterised protein [Stutzerimonas stutzeri]